MHYFCHSSAHQKDSTLAIAGYSEKIMIAFASRGLDRAFMEGIFSPGDTVSGVSHNQPTYLMVPENASLEWLEANGRSLKRFLAV
jgi:hypothetical protein